MREYSISQIYPSDKYSLSQIDALLQNEDWDTFKALVPPTTNQYFTSQEAAPILERIRRAGNVVHY